jgi:hypothetical protein
MTADDQKPPERKKRRKMSRSILLAARHGGRRRSKEGKGQDGKKADQARPDRSDETITLGEILEDLGERSFGWCLFVFTLISLLPLPIGSNMLTALPVIWVAGQMAAGYRHIHLPRIMTDRAFKRRSVRATIHRFRFLLRPLERIAHPRRPEFFTPSRERLIGIALLIFSLALFLPIPLSGYGPAIAIFISSLGLVERDGVVLMIGLAVGVLAVVITIVMALLILFGVHSLGAPAPL